MMTLRDGLRALILAAPLLLGGCGVYLHNARIETSTKAVKDDMAALTTPAYLAAQEQTLSAFATAEDKAVASMLVANRDYSMLNLIKPTKATTDPRTSGQLLADYINSQLEWAGGVKTTLDTATVQKLQTAPFVIATRDLMLAQDKRRLSGRVKAYADALGKAKTDCTNVLADSHAADAENKDAKKAFGQIFNVCTAFKKLQTESSQDCALGLPGGQLSILCEAINATPPSKDRARELEKAIEAMRKAAEPKDGKALEPQVASLIKQAEDKFSDVVDASTDEKYAAVLKALNAIFSVDLAKVVQDAAAAAKDADVQEAKEALLNALKLIDAIKAVATPSGAVLDEPSALLIGIAKTQHDLNLVQLDIDIADRKLEVSLRQAVALRTAIANLARAQAVLCDAKGCPANPDREAFAEAMILYLRATNQGIIPDKVLEFHKIQIDRAGAVQRAKATDADYRALIQPAVDQLAAYGAGGVKAETLGPFIAALPISAAILGK